MRSILPRKVVTAATGLSSRGIDHLEARDEFPQRVQVSTNRIGWYSDEVENWIETRQRGGRGITPVKAIQAHSKKCKERREAAA